MPTVWAHLLRQSKCALLFSRRIAAYVRKECERMKKIAVIMGSDSDLPVVEKAIDTLKEYGVPYEVHVYSAHRTPEEAREFALSARDKGFGAIIAAAGMAAHPCRRYRRKHHASRYRNPCKINRSRRC